jgi:glucose-6-phosphate 1-dehydrogenase
MVQNHLFQVLSLVVMDAPAQLDAASIQAEKLKVLSSIKPLHDFEKDIVF